jgi:CubicO group peptidase (beta-lactamase class C family)
MALTPGSSWAYSGGGYTLLQLAVDEITGLGIDAFMSRFIFKPSGMKFATFSPDISYFLKNLTG